MSIYTRSPMASRLAPRSCEELGTSLTLDEAIEALAVQKAPKSLLHGSFLLGLGAYQRNLLISLGLIQALAASTTFLGVFVETSSPDSSVRCLEDSVEVTWWEELLSLLRLGPSPLGQNEVVGGVSAIPRGMAEEWGLECGSEWKLALMGTLFFGGSAVGVAAGGHLADTVGRRKTLLGATALAAMAIPLAALAPNWIIYAALKIPQGAAVSVTFIVGYTLGMEYVPPGWRTYIGTGYFAFSFALGELALVCASLVAPYWRTLILMVAIPWVLLLGPLMRIIPESPRWLLAKSRSGDAESILRRAFAQQPNASSRFENLCPNEIRNYGKNAKKKDSGGDIRPLPPTPGSSLGSPALSSSSSSSPPIISSSASAASSVSPASSPLRAVMLQSSTWAMLFMWFVSSLACYGLNLSAAAWKGNLHQNAALFAAMELPASAAAVMALEHPRFGRRSSVSMFFLLGGVCCLLGSHPASPPALAFAVTLAGKLTLTAAFDANFQYSSELFPTVVRSTALGLCSAASRVGSMAAPPVAAFLTPGVASLQLAPPIVTTIFSQITDLLTPSPCQLFGTLSLAAAAACYYKVPETKNQNSATRMPNMVIGSLADLHEPNNMRSAISREV